MNANQPKPFSPAELISWLDNEIVVQVASPETIKAEIIATLENGVFLVLSEEEKDQILELTNVYRAVAEDCDTGILINDIFTRLANQIYQQRHHRVMWPE